MKAGDLPEPACKLGYTTAQALGILGPDRLARFNRWLRDRSQTDCDGERVKGCGPHGTVFPPTDLRTFLGRDRR